MKKILLFILLFIVIIAGCSQQKIAQKVIEKQYVCVDGRVVNTTQECTAQNVAVAEQKEVIPDTAQTQSPQLQQSVSEKKDSDYVFSLDEVRAMDKKLVGKRAVILKEAMDNSIKVGDNYVFGYAIQNQYVKPMEFTLHVKLFEAKTVSQGKIGADEKVEQWFRKVQDMQFNLSKNEVKYIPLYLTVGDYVNNDNLQTFDGTYTFTVFATVRDPSQDSNFKEDYANNQFFVRVDK